MAVTTGCTLPQTVLAFHHVRRSSASDRRLFLGKTGEQQGKSAATFAVSSAAAQLFLSPTRHPGTACNMQKRPWFVLHRC
eukprot:3217560-Rhodomonas_salina.1